MAGGREPSVSVKLTSSGLDATFVRLEDSLSKCEIEGWMTNVRATDEPGIAI